MNKMLIVSLVFFVIVFVGNVVLVVEKFFYFLGECFIFSDCVIVECFKLVGSVCVEGEDCGS